MMLGQYSQYGLQRQARSPDGDTGQDQAQGVPLQNGQETEAPGQDGQSKPDYSGQPAPMQRPQPMPMQPNPQAMQNQQQAAQNGQAMPQGQVSQQPAPVQPPPMQGRYNFQNRNPPNPRQFMNQMGRSFGR